ncbi:hypothetical protein ACIBJI_42025 [Nocardia sp. NPDC050408]|uniref:hypothetical protein n=1 Tax=Nocardia sp. NPDC050408 TaxID=3364319 RepID=UPI0037942AFF
MTEPEKEPWLTEVTARVVEGRLLGGLEGFVVAPDCLGEAYDTAIGGQTVKVLFPSPDPQDSSSNPVLVSPKVVFSPSVVCGRVASADRNRWVCADIEQLAYRFEMTGSRGDVREACRRIGQEFPAWWERLEMWLDTFTELDLLRHRRAHSVRLEPNFSAFSYPRDSDDFPNRVNWKKVDMDWINWRTHEKTFIPPAIEIPDHDVLTRCFRLAGEGAELPAEWQYMREARSWLNAGQTRHAVIDACTAAEIALAYQVHQLLAGTSTMVIEQLLKRCNGIANVADIVRKNGGTTASRNDVEGRLAKLRNSAAHAGNEPTHEQAKTAVAVAAAILGHARPRQTLH